LPVRVRLKLRTLKGSKPNVELFSNALLNTGFTGASLETIIPSKLAEQVGALATNMSSG
jgi:predicted aspartyl protease